MDLTDTIAAIASGNQPAPRGTIRISGPKAMDCVQRCFVSDAEETPWPGNLRTPISLAGRLNLPRPFSEIDCRVYCWPTNQSYTRQPSAEFHLVGSIPILNAALRVICESDVRLAEPGEFTMRAFLAGRLDLTQAEAVLGVIDARDQRELNVALAQLSGGLTTPLSELREQIIELLAHLEAGLDFVEEDIEFISTADLCDALSGIRLSITELQARMTTRDLQDQIPAVVLLGWPNSGKSSLFNRLGANERAIVTSQSGTTRDYLEQRILFDDTPCRLIDTAGFEFRPGDGSIESAAQQMTASRREHADLKLLCIDSTRNLNPWELEQLAEIDQATLVVLTKCDLSQAASLSVLLHLPSHVLPEKVLRTSSETGVGIDMLQQAIKQTVTSLARTSDLVVAETARRSADSLLHAAEAISRAIDVGLSSAGEELVAAELRDALDHLGRVVGAIYTDDILDQVFSRFCIGK